MRPIILFRKSLAEEAEYDVASQYFDVVEYRSDVHKYALPSLNLTRGLPFPDRKDLLVIPRYASLPYYQELETDVALLGGELINSYRQHQYVADLQNWYPDLADLTPKTWFRAEDITHDHPGPFVLKGHTNSRKHKWRTHAFAETRADVGPTLCNLLDDPLISEQGVCIREFEKFETFATDEITGMPVTNEWRYFCLDGQILACGFYWSSHTAWLEEHGHGPVEIVEPAGAHTFVQQVLDRIEDKIRFVVIDIARTPHGGFRLVELNCGTMSGTSCVDYDELYSNMARVLDD